MSMQSIRSLPNEKCMTLKIDIRSSFSFTITLLSISIQNIFSFTLLFWEKMWQAFIHGTKFIYMALICSLCEIMNATQCLCANERTNERVIKINCSIFMKNKYNKFFPLHLAQNTKIVKNGMVATKKEEVERKIILSVLIVR